MESKVRASFRGCVSFSRESFCFRSKYFHGSAVYYPSWLKYLIQHFIIVIERNDKATYGCESIDNTLLRVRTVENHFSIRVTVRTINYSFSHGYFEWDASLLAKAYSPRLHRSWIHFEYIRIQIYSRWKKKKFDFSKNTFKMPDKKFELRKAVWGLRVGGDV